VLGLIPNSLSRLFKEVFLMEVRIKKKLILEFLKDFKFLNDNLDLYVDTEQKCYTALQYRR
jgi:hypothetical protein